MRAEGESTKLVKQCAGADPLFCTPLIDTQVLDFFKARVLMALLVMRDIVAPESSRALDIMVFPVGPVSFTWQVINRLLGNMSVEREAVVLTAAVGVWAGVLDPSTWIRL